MQRTLDDILDIIEDKMRDGMTKEQAAEECYRILRADMEIEMAEEQARCDRVVSIIIEVKSTKPDYLDLLLVMLSHPLMPVRQIAETVRIAPTHCYHMMVDLSLTIPEIKTLMELRRRYNV